MLRKAVLEVVFIQEDMIDEETLRTEYNNNLLKVMKELFKCAGFRIFDQPIKLVAIK
jgi:hypothetical protein